MEAASAVRFPSVAAPSSASARARAARSTRRGRGIIPPSGAEPSGSEDDPTPSNHFLMEVIKTLAGGIQARQEQPVQASVTGPQGQVSGTGEAFEILDRGLDLRRLELAQAQQLRQQLGAPAPPPPPVAPVPQEVTPSASTLLAFRNHNEEHAAQLRSFMENPKRGARKWEPTPIPERPSLPSQGSEVVDMEPVILGLPAPKRLLRHSQTILDYEKDVPVRSLLSGSVRLTPSQYAQHCSFSTQVSTEEANYLGHYSSGKVSSEKQVEKLIEQAKHKVWSNAKDALQAPQCALKDSLVVGSANEASLVAIEEAMMLADDSYEAIQRALDLVSSLTSCPSAERREVKTDLKEAAAHSSSLLRRLGIARTASKLVDNVSVSMTDTAARGVRTAISHARGEAMDALFGSAKSSANPARQSFRNDILHLPFSGTSLFGGRLTQATTAAVEVAQERNRLTKHLSQIGLKAKGTWTRPANANPSSGGANAKRNNNNGRRQRGRRARKVWGPVPDKPAPATNAKAKGNAPKPKPKQGKGNPGKGGKKTGKKGKST